MGLMSLFVKGSGQQYLAQKEMKKMANI